MLSRRDKLLVQPWEDRRFKDHRSKVRSALPAIDARAPPARPHVALKLKKVQREQDRTDRIERDNFSLLQRLGDIMRVKRLDNRWDTPLPNLNHKVGLFYEAGSVGARRAPAQDIHSDPDSYPNVRCYACEYRKKSITHMSLGRIYEGSLPSIYSPSNTKLSSK